MKSNDILVLTKNTKTTDDFGCNNKRERDIGKVFMVYEDEISQSNPYCNACYFKYSGYCIVDNHNDCLLNHRGYFFKDITDEL